MARGRLDRLRTWLGPRDRGFGGGTPILILKAMLPASASKQPFWPESVKSHYFSAARSLAEGGGYTLPSVPGAPPQTKYPPLYAWLLFLGVEARRVVWQRITTWSFNIKMGRSEERRVGKECRL